MNSFRLSAIDPQPFADFFEQSDHALRAQGVVRCIADAFPGFPCRASLEDAAIGEELLLLPYRHLAANSPYQASGPIYLRRHTERRVLAAGDIPAYVSRRLISVRGYDADHMMRRAEVCEGGQVAAELLRQFEDDGVAYIHLHNARQGCFSCRVDRA